MSWVAWCGEAFASRMIVRTIGGASVPPRATSRGCGNWQRGIHVAFVQSAVAGCGKWCGSMVELRKLRVRRRIVRDS